MSNRELAIELIQKLPEDTPLEEMARELELLAGISIARDQARRGQGTPAEDARKLNRFMGLPVILTPQSLDDLASIVRRIAIDSPERARAFGNLLIDKALSIAPFPERGRVVPEFHQSSVREIIHGLYRIIYEVLGQPKAVYVLRFWHAARGTPDVGGSR